MKALVIYSTTVPTVLNLSSYSFSGNILEGNKNRIYIHGECTFPSLFQVMKKPNSSTLIWQLGSKIYGSCREKNKWIKMTCTYSFFDYGFIWHRHYTTCKSTQRTRWNSKSFYKIYLPKEKHTRGNPHSKHCTNTYNMNTLCVQGHEVYY